MGAVEGFEVRYVPMIDAHFRFCAVPATMELLNSIQDDVLQQMQEEAVNYFSCVADFRHFIVATRPATDVCVTLKMFAYTRSVLVASMRLGSPWRMRRNALSSSHQWPSCRQQEGGNWRR